MSKTRIKYICSNCGYESLRWLGKCPECESWNSFTEEIIETSKRKPTISKSKFIINTIDTISANEGDRIKTGIAEFDRVLGGGLMQGSVILLGGDPGIGKSTLAMQQQTSIKKYFMQPGRNQKNKLKLEQTDLNLNHLIFMFRLRLIFLKFLEQLISFRRMLL